MLALNTPDGKQIPARITEITDEGVTIDINHPLAGKTLNFKIKVVDISDSSEEKNKDYYLGRQFEIAIKMQSWLRHGWEGIHGQISENTSKVKTYFRG